MISRVERLDARAAQLRFAADAGLAVARPAQLKPGTLGGRARSLSFVETFLTNCGTYSTERPTRLIMAARKQFQSTLVVKPGLQRLLSDARQMEVSEDDLHEQRISFAFGNAPESSLITKDSVRLASKHIRLKR
jgi:hypothetical protein